VLWSQVIAGQVPALARARGATYFDQGRVVALSGRGHSLLARVRGTLVYDVRIEVDGAQLNATCTCPAAGRAPCKHVWAALLEAERLGRISSPAEVSPAGASGPSPSGLTRGPDRPLALWRDRLEVIATTQGTTGLRPPAPALAQEGDEILYVLDLPSSLAQGALHVETHIARRRRDGQPGEPRPFPIGRGEAALLPDAADRRALLLLLGARRGLYEEHLGRADTFRIGADAVPALVEVLARTGRARVQVTREGAPVALRWQAEPGFELQLRVRERDEDYVLAASLRAGEVERPLADAALVLRQGAVFFADGVAGPFDDRGLWPFVRDLRQHRELAVPIRHASRLLSALAAAGPGPLAAVELPADLQVAVVQAAPRPRLRVDPDPRDPRRLLAQLAFDYDGGLAPDDAGPAAFHFDAATRRLLVRDTEAEEGARDELLALGLRRVNTGAQFYLAPRRLAEVVRALAPRGFLIEVDGRVQRPSGSVRYRVSSGVDWFDLDAEVDFGGGATARLPALLEAARTGSATVVLDDGSSGLLPEEWLARQGFLRALGELEGGRLRFRSAQATLIGELLAEASSLEADEGFHEARARLRAFSRVRAADPPAGFHGTLRPYQREGLGWLRFLREFSLGGCLADDMGLGKTVQVLALLEERRATARHPSLVVVPRSLVFNWQEEAARFVPGLRVRDHTGLERARGGEAFADADLVLTTYGTLRRDIRMLEGLRFDYVILDEAQNVKNHRTEAARAVRRLRADHRLALTGTPLENHLGELRSLLDFLNPGLLGAGRRRPAGEDRADPALRAGGQGADAVPRAGDPLPAHAAGPGRRARHGALEDPGAGGAAAAAPGRLPPSAGRSDPGRSTERQARAARGPDRGGARRGAQGAGVFAVHQLSGDRPRPPRRPRRQLRVPRRADARSPAPGRAFSDRPAMPALLDQSQSRWARAQLDGSRLRLLARPVVEPGGRDPGDRSHAPHRSGQARLRLPADRARHRRGEGARAATAQASACGRHHRCRPQRAARHRGRGSRAALVVKSRR
jgi:hypothetical protein